MSATAKQVEVKEHPILFSGPMVKAILEGRKTQTRRVALCMTGTDFATHHKADEWVISSTILNIAVGLPKKTVSPRTGNLVRCPYGKIGDRLWVREAWRTEERESDLVDGIRFRADDHFQIIADTQQASEDWVVANNNRRALVWRPSIFLPRWASRITLEITNIKVERLQNINEADSIAEGVRELRDGSGTYAGREGPGNLVTPWPTAKEAFADRWDVINGKRAPWAANNWVWVIEFKKL